MTLDSIKQNTDKRIESLLKEKNRTFPEIVKKLKKVEEDFLILEEAEVNNSAKKAIIRMYINHSEKRIKDIDLIERVLMTDEYFAGADELKFLELIRFRDKVSGDVIATV